MSLTRIIAALATLCALAMACSGGGSGSLRPDTGVLLATSSSGLGEYRPSSHRATALIDFSNTDMALFDPAVSPDGRRIAYVVQPASRMGMPFPKAALWIANRDASSPALANTGISAARSVRSPQWQDESHILAIVEEPALCDGCNPDTTASYVLERIDVASGSRERLRNEVASFGISNDRNRVAYSVEQDGELFVRDLNRWTEIVAVARTERLFPFDSPRFSPDGLSIAFGSAEAPTTRTDDGGVLASLPDRRVANADGEPEDVWTVGSSGGSPRRLAELRVSTPSLAWSGDGVHLYVLAGRELHDIDVVNGAHRVVVSGPYDGQIAWSAQ